MAEGIVGKRWTATWVRSHSPADGELITMHYASGLTTQEELETMYPALAASVDIWQPSSQLTMRGQWLRQNYPSNPKYYYQISNPNLAHDPLGDELAMLDDEIWEDNNESGLGDSWYQGGGGTTSIYFVAWDVAIPNWATGTYPGGLTYDGDPDPIWDLYPDNPTFAAVTPATFEKYDSTDLGAGEIRYQLITWYDALAASISGVPQGFFHTALPASPPSPDMVEFPNAEFSVQATDLVYLFTPVYDEIPPDTPPPEEEEGVHDDDLRLRVWGYSLDGHDYYVLRLGDSETLVYDLTTGQWADWKSPDEDKWRAIAGINWIGMGTTTAAHGFSSDVVAGDDTTSVLWMLDPFQGQDDDPFEDGLKVSFTRVVTGGVPLESRDVKQCNAVQLNLSLGNSQPVDATITLSVSDDAGNTVTAFDSYVLPADTFDNVVEWRSLGLMRAPGRLFTFTDTGAAVRIDGADLR